METKPSKINSTISPLETGTIFTRPEPANEYFMPEGCWILESWNTSSDDAVSIARARVEVGVTTQLHRLTGIVERYLIIAGRGIAKVGNLEGQRVELGDVVTIPSGVTQQITNDGDRDLVFYCVCTPRFTRDCYEIVER